MKLGIVGLGRMGHAIALRVLDAGHEVIGFDIDKKHVAALKKAGGEGAESLEQLATETRVVWLMVPAGKVVDSVVKELLPHLKAGDIIVDGGNSNFIDSMTRAQICAAQDVFFLDCGTSGGVHGRAKGFCLMVGGDHASYIKIHDILVAIAAPDGVGYIGSSGTGHYVKMIHNGIEYALLQAYAEGLHIIREGTFKDEVLDLEEITRIWNHGSIIRSWILELFHEVLAKDQSLKKVSGKVAATGMGKWTVEEAEKRGIPVRVIKEALEIRNWSRETGGDYGTKLVALLRNAFGGHGFQTIEIEDREEDED